MYWIYDLPNWLFFLLTVSVFVGASLGGFFLTRPLVRSVVDSSGKYNDVTNFYFAAVGVLYGLTLGLIAVGTWQNFNDVDAKASKEANALSALYRDLDGYPAELREECEKILCRYAQVVISEEWPAHQRGEVTDSGDLILEEFENRVMAYEPPTETQKIVHTEVINSLSELATDRGYRLQSVRVALPAVLWAVVLVGAVITIGLSYLFWIENLRLHLILIAALASALGMLIFLTAAMDNPYRGKFSVSAEAFQYSLEHVMTKTSR